MSQPEQKPYRGIPKKRKRPYSSSPVVKTNGDFLRIEESKPPSKFSILEEEKVINSINRFKDKGIGRENERIYCVRVVVGLTEAEYFVSEGEAFVKRMIDTFGINDIRFSEHHKGSVERIISIYGDYVPVAKVGVYIGYVLSAKLNNVLQAELFTLKSPNYKLKLLVSTKDEAKLREFADRYGLTEFDTSFPFFFNQNSNFYAISLTGDLHSIFDFIFVTTLYNVYYDNFDDPNIKMTELFGIHLDGGLYSRTEEETNRLKLQANEVLNYIYSKSFLSQDN